MNVCDTLRATMRAVKCPTPSSKLVLLAVIDLEGEEYTQARLAAHTGFSLRQIGTLLKALETAGILTRERRGGAGTGRLPDRHTLNPAALRIAESPNAQCEEVADCALPIADCPAPKTPRAATTAQIPPIADCPVSADAQNPPYDNNSTPLANLQPQLLVEGGVGETKPDFALTPPGRRTREPKPAKRASEASMPKAMTARMRADANAAGKLNGTGEAEFARWRDHHLTKATEIADHEASFRTWLRNAEKFAAQDKARAPVSVRNGVYRRPRPAHANA